MFKLLKKISILVLALFVMLNLNATKTIAANNGSERLNQKAFEVGKSYIVPVTRLDRYGLPIDWKIEDEAIKEWGEDLVSRTAVVTPKEDGTFDVTLEWAMYNLLDSVQFFDQNIIKEKTATEAMKAVIATPMGTYNIPDRFFVDFSKASSKRHQSFDFTDIMKTLFSENENSKYYNNVKVTNSQGKNIYYVTVNLSSVEDNLYFKALETWKYAKFTPSEFYKPNKPENREAILQRSRECITNGGFSFDISNAKEIKNINNFNSETTQVSIERAAESLNLEHNVASNKETENKVQNLFKGNPEVKQSPDGKLNITYTLADVSKITGIGVASSRTELEFDPQMPMINQTNASYYITRAYARMNYTPLEIKGDKFTITYDNTEDAVWGKIIKVTNAEGRKEDFTDVVVDTNYLFTLKLSCKEASKKVFESNEWKFVTEKENVPENSLFTADPIVEGEDFINIQKKLNGYSEKNKLWKVTLNNADVAIEPKNAVAVHIAIPEGWNNKKLSFYYLNGAAKDGALVNIKDFKVENNEVIFTTKELNRTFVLSQDSVEADISNLEDGLYSIDITSWNVSQKNEVSMSNAALESGTSFIEVKNGEYVLYLRLQGITIGNDFGYAQKLFYKDEHAIKQEVEYLGWMLNKEGTSIYNIDYYGEKYGLYYPASIRFPLSRNNIVRNNHEIDFWVPIMDEVSGAVPGSGVAHRTALFKFYNLKKITENPVIPTYEPSFLLKSIEDAEVYTKAEEITNVIYDAEAFKNLKKKTEAARETYQTILKTPNGTVIYDTATELDTVVRTMIVTSLTKEIKVAESLKAEDYLPNSYQKVTEALLEANKVNNNEKAANKDIVKALRELYDAVQTLVKKADKNALQILLDKAKAINPVEYTPETSLALQAAIEAAETVMKDEMAEQTVVDAQIKNLQAAIDALIPVKENKYEDGLYQINASLAQAGKPESPSMADNALEKPSYIRMKDGNATLVVGFKPLTIGSMTGYLGELCYYPDYTDTTTEPGDEVEPAQVITESYYDGVNDSYNDPENGTDGVMKGKQYPHEMSFPVETEDDEIWVRVYVPVMAAINPASGYQNARLKLDWSAESFKKVEEEQTDRSALEQKLTEAKAVEQGYATEETWNALQTAIVAAEAVLNDTSATQEQIDAQIPMLEAAMNAVAEENKKPVEADKTGLKQALKIAETEYAKIDVYTAESLEALKKTMDEANAVVEDPQATQEMVDANEEALNTAVKALIKIDLEAADKAAAAEVDALIDAIGTVTVDSKEAIEAARSAYDALTEEQKAFVEKLGVLEAAEATLEELLKPVVTGWTQNGNIWGYVKEDGTAAANEFVTVGANTFYFDNNGAMVTGWKEVDGNWYYFYTSGRMLYGWQKIGNNWFYLGTDGIMATGWQKIGNNWFYFYTSGRMLTGWQKIGNNWFYFYSSGRMATGWQKIGNNWFYFYSSGRMLTGWQKIGVNWFYFYTSGRMVTGTQVIGGKTYYFANSGALIR